MKMSIPVIATILEIYHGSKTNNNKKTNIVVLTAHNSSNKNNNLGAEYLSPKKANLLNYTRFIQAPKG